MLRGGITLALIKVLVVRVLGVLWSNPGCLIYRSTTHRSSNQSPHMFQPMQCANTWWHDILKCTLEALNMTNKLNGVPVIFLALFGITPYLNLVIIITTRSHYYNCDQWCMMIKIFDHSSFSDHFGIRNTFFGGPGKKLLIL